MEGPSNPRRLPPPLPLHPGHFAGKSSSSKNHLIPRSHPPHPHFAGKSSSGSKNRLIPRSHPPHPNRSTGFSTSRKKVKLQWIVNAAARRAAYKKRKKGLMKKVEEISVLHNVKACAVVYGPNHSKPDVWPSVEEAAEILRTFRSLPEFEQTRNMLTQEAFLRQQITKTQETVRRQRDEIAEMDTALTMYQGLKGMSLRHIGKEEKARLVQMVDNRVGALYQRMAEVEKELLAASSVHPLPPPPPPFPHHY